LRYGITEVFVESEQSHRLKALLLARDQLVKMKRRLYGEIRGVLRPFGIRLPARAGTRRFDAAARAACREDDVLHGCVHALPEALGAIEAQLAALEERVRISTRSDETAWRLMSVPGVGPVTALAFQAAIEDPDRFRRSRDVGAYLGLTPSCRSRHRPTTRSWPSGAIPRRPRSGRSKMRATAGKSGVSSAKAAAVTGRVRFGMRCVGKATTSPGSHGGKADESDGITGCCARQEGDHDQSGYGSSLP
jgi:hypothetical protein